MQRILKTIVEQKRKRIPAQLPEQGPYTPRRGHFSDMMKEKGISFICEYKKASPSKGNIRGDLTPEETALMYQKGGARAISVLTEEDFFKGSLDFIGRIRAVTGLPVLRKDFICEEVQVRETACAGADCILLIASVLGEKLGTFVEKSHESGLDVLAEVHSRVELRDVLETEADMIGINNRDLNTFTVSLETTAQISRCMDGQRILISESGIRTREDVEYLESCGADGVLVGETLMRSSDIVSALAGLRGAV